MKFLPVFVLIFCCCTCSPPNNFLSHAGEKLPLRAEMFYQENNVLSSIDPLLDGNLKVNFKPGTVLLNTGPHTIVCDFPAEWKTIPRLVRVYDNGESDAFTQPTRFFLERSSDHAEIEIGSFDGAGYQQWTEFPITQAFEADRLIIRGYTNNGAGSYYGTELEVYGDYKKDAAPPEFHRAAQPLKNMMGTNGLVWDLMQDPKNPSIHNGVYLPKLQRLKEMGITMERFYMKWAELEPQQGVFDFNPTVNGWYYDSLFSICKNNGIEPLPDIMGLAPHVFNTWPDNDNDKNNLHPNTYSSPVRYADRDKREDPQSYHDIARSAFVIAARWGNNTNIDDRLLGRAGAGNILRKGTGMVHYLEFLNEPDSYWNGVYEYMSGYKLAAFLSAIYDGNKRTMDVGFGKGVGVGIKNADSTLKLVISGLSMASTDALRAIWDWSREHRGYKADGSVDLPYDIINYHKYSTDGRAMFGAPNTTGMPPESSDVLTAASDFVRHSNRMAGGREVWLTEWGYDYHPESLFSAPVVDHYSRFEVIGAWALRNIFLHSLKGIDRMIWFKQFDDDSLNAQFFSTMSLLSQNDAVYTRRVVGDYYMQLKPLGDFKPDSLLFTHPYVARFKKDDGSLLYAVWGKEKLSPASIRKQGKELSSYRFQESNGIFGLYLRGNPLIEVKHFQPRASEMQVEQVQVKNNSYEVHYGMTPVLIEVPAAKK